MANGHRPAAAAHSPAQPPLPAPLQEPSSIDQATSSLQSPATPTPAHPATPLPLPPPPPPSGLRQTRSPSTAPREPRGEARTAISSPPAIPVTTKRVRFAITPPRSPATPSCSLVLHPADCLPPAPCVSGTRSAFTTAAPAATAARPASVWGETSIPPRTLPPPETPQCRRHPAEEDLDGWTTVRRKRTRDINAPSRQPPTRPPPLPSPAKDKLLVSMRGKCFRCLARGHLASACRDPLKCFNCGRSGHKAWQCSQTKLAPAPPPPCLVAPAPPPPRLDSNSFPRLTQAAMPRPGDPEMRPSETFAVVAASSDMELELERLSTHAVVAWLGGSRPDVGLDKVKKAFCHQFGVRPSDIEVARHHPADFLVTFTHQHHRDAAVDRRDFPFGNLDFRVRRWQLVTASKTTVDLKYHVRLCLKRIPLHAWNESIAKRAVARSCDLDYVELQSLRKEDTRALSLWAWTEDPSFIPKVTWLTIIGRSLQFHDRTTPPTDRSGLLFRVIVHLDLVEDPQDRDGRRVTRDYKWSLGTVDGARAPRDHHDPPPLVIRGSDRRDDDDDDEHRGRSSRKEGNWGVAIAGNGCLAGA
ncbi:hypothetical protein BS78_09G175800 [Paspalum vaginatum]|nr:hypothetical protein BS78_09G175800 [Paspalum vaginatum]